MVKKKQLMYCMNNNHITKQSILIAFICVITPLYAQTYYYKLTKKIVNNENYTNMAGGQFVTFNGDICFDSDDTGFPVGNGSLTYKSDLSKTLITYEGNCYFGSQSYYRFNSDKSVLNIITRTGKIYVYKRSTPPAGVTTCSLIKQKASGGGNGGGVVVSNVPQTIGGGYYNNGGSISSNGNSGSTSTSQQRTQPVQHTCPRCHGNRTIVRESNVATYGNDTQRYCSICGRNYWASSGHSHVTCPQCYGKGYFTTN